MENYNEIKGDTNTRSYGVYFIKDTFAQGRVSGFIPYPSDIVAAYAFKDFVENKEKMKIFPFPKKLELIRLCEIDQLTDRLINDSTKLNRTICNGETINSYIDVSMKKYNETMEL